MKDHEYTIGKANEIVKRRNQEIYKILHEAWITSDKENEDEKHKQMTQELARQRTLNVPDEEELRIISYKRYNNKS